MNAPGTKLNLPICEHCGLAVWPYSRSPKQTTHSACRYEARKLVKRALRTKREPVAIPQISLEKPEKCLGCARSHSTEADQRQCDERAQRAARDVAMRGGR